MGSNELLAEHLSNSIFLGTFTGYSTRGRFSMKKNNLFGSSNSGVQNEQDASVEE